jgi:hypothetical protein
MKKGWNQHLNRRILMKDKNNMRVELVGRMKDDAELQLAVYAVDAKNSVIESVDIDRNGSFTLSQKTIASARQILVGPKVKKIESSNKKAFAVYRMHQFQNIMESSGVLEITPVDWNAWLKQKRCVSGSAKHCSCLMLSGLLKKAYTDKMMPSIGKVQAEMKSAAFDSLSLAVMQPLYPLMKCDVICDGLVEVYRRTCCCYPWIIFDPRLPELIKDLEKILIERPPIKWPPHPDPDPYPLRKTILKNGTIDEFALNAETDLLALRSLPAEQIPLYINPRPWLLCRCGLPKKVAQGNIRADGKFNICWSEFPQLHYVNCHEEYAYVIKQNINGLSTVIYDGLSAKKWFKYDDDALLVSYHPDAIICRNDPFPDEEGAFVLLQDIGLTSSFNLKTPDSASWDSVEAPSDYNDGLAFPASDAAAAKGHYKDRNWGGQLLLRYHFSEPMKDLGAKYYRVSVVKADVNGNPSGTRTYLSCNEWYYYEIVGSDIYVLKQSLGPKSAGTQPFLYEIPYDADRDWQSGQYHALLNTTDFENGRFLLTVEIFNASGELLRPTGTDMPTGVTSTEKGFTFRRWYQETGPTAEVPYAALTHMFWWDNRKAEAQIVDLRKNGLASTAECQFLNGIASSKFSVGYRAYHPEPMFLLNYYLWWKRGLGGSTGALTYPYPNTENVGVPPASAYESMQVDFGTMLGTHTKCSFSVNLQVHVKTFNGVGTLDSLDDWDQGAFALDITGLSLSADSLAIKEAEFAKA